MKIPSYKYKSVTDLGQMRPCAS